MVDAALAFVDLDGTVFSRAAAGAEIPRGHVVVDVGGDGHRRTMSVPAVDAWRRLVGLGVLVPATARSTAQYLRLVGLGAPLAVVTAGALVLRDGRLDRSWQRRVASAVASTGAGAADVASEVSRAAPGREVRIVDDVLVVAIASRGRHGGADRGALADVAARTGWPLVVSGRKAYLAPPGIDKGAAARWLADERGARLAVAAGDTELDRSLLAAADVALVPRDADLHVPLARIVHGDVLAEIEALLSATGPGAPPDPGG